MNNVLLYLGGLLVVALAALFAVPHFVDWNGYRGVFEEEASKVLGRDVRVGGAVNVRFLPTPFVRFEKVRLADPTGQTGEPFIRVDSFTMRLSGPALLRGVLEANDIELQRPVLTLALDGKGSGNWSNVQIKPGALPFVPQDVALRSVKVTDGAVALFNSESQQIGRAESINGEFSADALKGPYKFKGQAIWSGEPRDVKFATTPLEADGGFRFKVSIHATKSAATFLLDGRLEDLSGLPKLTGELTGKLPLDAGADAAVAPAAGQGNAEPPVLDLKSRIEANTASAKVTDIVLSLDNATEPQLIAGSAAAFWGKEQRLDISLASKWLDLDRLSGAGQDSATFSKVRRLGLSSLRALAGEGGGIAAAKIDVEQVKLGGETAGGLRVDAVSSGDAVHLSELKAGLPGGSRLDLTGDIKDEKGNVRFAGFGFVHGASLSRLLSWAAKSGANLDVAADGPYSAEGRLVVDDARFELAEASADIGGRPFSGDIVVSGEWRRKVAVTLEGARLDSSELFPAMSRALEDNLRRAFGFMATAGKSGTAAVEKGSGDGVGNSGDISVRVLAGELKHGDKLFRNVDATVGLDGGNIRIPSAKFTTSAGLTVAVDGRIDNAEKEPKGTLAYDIAAKSPEALNDFVVLTGLNGVVPAGRIAATSTAKLAGLLHLGSRGPASADISADGTIELAYVTGHAEFDGGLQGWRTAPSRVRVSARAPALAPLLGAFGFNTNAAAQAGAHEAELVFASTGALATASAALLDITAPGLAASYNGSFALPADGPVALAGTLALKASDLSDVTPVAGLTASGGLAGVPVEGELAVKREADTWTVSSNKLAFGAPTVTGNVKIASPASGPAAISGNLHADTISAAGLLAAISGAPATGDSSKAAVWPASGFAFDMLSGLSGDIHVGYDTLALQPGLAAHGGEFKLTLAGDKVVLSDLKGHAAGGGLSGSVQLAKASGGVSLESALKIENANLAELGATAAGKAGVEFKAAAQAQSPAALMAALSGEGVVTLSDAKLPVPGPATGSDAVAAVLANKIPNEPEAIASVLKSSAQAASTALGGRSIPFVISGGAAKLQPVTLETSDGSVSAVTVVDLTSLAIDSAWRVAPFVPPMPQLADALPGWVAPPAKGTLPPASIMYTGQLADLKSVAVNADASDFQRELAVRLVERNLEELERLKLQDQQRVKAELERRQAIEAERAATAAAAAAAKAAAAAGQASPAVPPAPGAVASPPVIPESAGTAPAPGNAAPASAAVGAVPPAQGSIAVEPDPQAAAAAAAQEKSAAAPAAEKPVAVPRPQPARAAPARPPPRRTSSDEVMRSLGGFP